MAYCRLRRPPIRHTALYITPLEFTAVPSNATGIAIDSPLPYLIEVDETELSKTLHRISIGMGALGVLRTLAWTRAAIFEIIYTSILRLCGFLIGGCEAEDRAEILNFTRRQSMGYRFRECHEAAVAS